MRSCFDLNAKNVVARRRYIEEHTGKSTSDNDFIAADFGNFFLGDSISLEQSQTHIIMNGSGDWAVNLSFGLDLWEARAADITRLAQDIFSSGIAASGLFGYGLNVSHQSLAETEEQDFAQVIQRFPLLNPMQPGLLKFHQVDELGVYPVGCWYVLDDDWALKNGIEPAGAGNLAKDMFSVERAANGHLFKLWGQPMLADQQTDADLGPVMVLSQYLRPALEGSRKTHYDGPQHQHSLLGIAVGDLAARRQFYLRFLS